METPAAACVEGLRESQLLPAKVHEIEFAELRNNIRKDTICYLQPTVLKIVGLEKDLLGLKQQVGNITTRVNDVCKVVEQEEITLAQLSCFQVEMLRRDDAGTALRTKLAEDVQLVRASMESLRQEAQEQRAARDGMKQQFDMMVDDVDKGVRDIAAIRQRLLELRSQCAADAGTLMEALDEKIEMLGSRHSQLVDDHNGHSAYITQALVERTTLTHTMAEHRQDIDRLCDSKVDAEEYRAERGRAADMTKALEDRLGSLDRKLAKLDGALEERVRSANNASAARTAALLREVRGDHQSELALARQAREHLEGYLATAREDIACLQRGMADLESHTGQALRTLGDGAEAAVRRMQLDHTATSAEVRTAQAGFAESVHASGALAARVDQLGRAMWMLLQSGRATSVLDPTGDHGEPGRSPSPAVGRTTPPWQEAISAPPSRPGSAARAAGATSRQRSSSLAGSRPQSGRTPGSSAPSRPQSGLAAAAAAAPREAPSTVCTSCGGRVPCQHVFFEGRAYARSQVAELRARWLDQAHAALQHCPPLPAGAAKRAAASGKGGRGAEPELGGPPDAESALPLIASGASISRATAPPAPLSAR
ncbi:unnamed protein product [Prorocentrum cordatum]|uniref:Cilia- and flagella-associated protein 157 n=1 Tax=Prorocentrum cordatum TaxID=2364126 RepID=A0ABN9U1W6_9DINO|nr:unnamed protein product [Polarella glacialis]